MIDSIDIQFSTQHERNGVMELAKGLFGMSNYTKSAAFMSTLIYFKAFTSKAERERAPKVLEELRKKFLVIFHSYSFIFSMQNHLLYFIFFLYCSKQAMLGDDGVFLYPTFITPAPAVGEISLQYCSAIYSLVANVFGFPSTHVPMGLNDEGLPIGFQVNSKLHYFGHTSIGQTIV